MIQVTKIKGQSQLLGQESGMAVKANNFPRQCYVLIKYRKEQAHIMELFVYLHTAWSVFFII